MENNVLIEKETKDNDNKGFREKLLDFFKIFTVSSKTRIGRVYKTIGICFLYILAIVGIVFGVLNFKDRDEKKGLFGNSYKITYKLDVDDTNDSIALNQTKESADKFGKWLLYKGTSVNGISYEVKKENNKNVGYLYVDYLNVPQLFFNEDNDEVDVNPSIVGVTNLHNSNIELWEFDQPQNHNWTNQNTPYDNKPILDSSNFNYNSARKDNRSQLNDEDKTQNTNGVVLDLTGSYDLSNGSKFKTLADITDYNQEVNGTLQWVVFYDMDSLVNKLNYAKWVVINHDKFSKNNSGASKDEQRKWALELRSLETYEPELYEWAKIASFQKDSSQVYNATVITKEDLFKYYQAASGVDKFANYPTDANESLKTVVDKYVLGTISKDNYYQWFPTSGSEVNFSRQNSISIQKTNATTVQQSELIYEFKNTALPVQFEQPAKGASITSTSEFSINGNGWISKPYIQDSITSFSSYEAIMLASGVVLLIIAIIVSVLYRIPGIMASFAVISSFIFSACLLVLLDTNFSIATVVGLFVGLILAIVCVSFTMERVRRLLAQKNSVFDSIQTALKKSLLTVVDLNATTIIIALSLFFFSKGELSDLGLSLVLTPLLIMGSVYIFFYYPLYLYSGDRKFWNAKYAITKLPSEEKIKMWFDDKKWWFIWAIFILLVIIAGTVYAFIGVKSASFNQGTIIFISGVNDQDASLLNNIFKQPNWFATSFSNGVFEATSNNSYSLNDITKLLGSINYESWRIDVSIASPSIPSEVFKSGIFGLMAGFAFASIYYVIRSNVLVIIPLFLANCFTVLASVSVSYLVQFPVTNFFVYAMTMAGLVANISACLFISVIRTRFDRRKIFEIDKIKMFIKNNLRSLMNTIFLTTGSMLVMFGLMAALVSTTTILVFINIAFVGILSMYVSFFMIAHIYYYVIILRQSYVNNIFYNIDNRINNKFVEVDEQLIYSINKFN